LVLPLNDDLLATQLARTTHNTVQQHVNIKEAFTSQKQKAQPPSSLLKQIADRFSSAVLDFSAHIGALLLGRTLQR
jgi:hypothetical protein